MSLNRELAPHLPFLRRYARALAGSQAEGDSFLRATLEAITSSPGDFPRDMDPRLGLYRTFHLIWASAKLEESEEEGRDGPEAGAGPLLGTAGARLQGVAPLARQALLLTAMEGFTEEDAGFIIGVSAEEARKLVEAAHAEIERRTRADILIVEDDPMVAMDLETIVRDLGHRVAAVAATHGEAVEAALAKRPGLILADIQLADGSSGIEAVGEILTGMSVPVIYITGFPERLLGAPRPEPTFLISKPFQRATVRAAIAQALFFDSATLPA